RRPASGAAAPHFPLDVLQELHVGLGLGQPVDDQFGGFGSVHVVGELADGPDEAQFFLAEEQLLPAGAGALDVDGGEDAALGQAPVQVQLHVAGALEFLVNDVVHAAARVHQGGADDGEAAPFLQVAGGAEEPLGLVEGRRIQAAGQGAAAGGDDQIVGPGQPGDAVQEDDHVVAVLHQALGPLQHHVGQLHVVLGHLVEGGGQYLAPDRPLHLRHFFGPLVDEQHEEPGVGVVGGDAVGDLLQQDRLARLGGRHHQGPLAFADGSEQVHYAGGDVVGRVF